MFAAVGPSGSWDANIAPAATTSSRIAVPDRHARRAASSGRWPPARTVAPGARGPARSAVAASVGSGVRCAEPAPAGTAGPGTGSCVLAAGNLGHLRRPSGWCGPCSHPGRAQS